jgi:protein-disulfide isomerase
MRIRISAVAVASAILLAACGVDTTGISPDSSRPIRGNASASVTLTEFGDLQCPACKSAHDLINKPLLAKYGTKVRFQFKHFPLTGIHVYALEAGEAAECAADQGKFWEFFDLDYAEQENLSSAQLREWAKTLGLNMDIFERCVSSGIKEATVMADEAEGEKAGVNSTPSYFVNGVRVQNNNVDAISAAIDQALLQTQNAPL